MNIDAFAVAGDELPPATRTTDRAAQNRSGMKPLLQ
jgi:hypothetical protein